MKSLLDSDGIAGLGTKIVEFLDNTLIAIRIFAQRIDNPELAQVHGGSNGGRFGVTGDELDVLNTTTLIKLV